MHWWEVTGMRSDSQIINGWVSEDHIQKVSPFAWPGFEIVDATSITPQDAFQRQCLVTGKLLPSEAEGFRPSAEVVNNSALMQALEKATDSNGDGTLDTAELKRAMTLPALAQGLSRIIGRYESEWGGNVARWEALTPFMKDGAARWKRELERITALQWWPKVSGVPGPTVYHFHPFGMIGNFFCGCDCINIDAFLKEYEVQHTSFESGTSPLDASSKQNLKVLLEGIIKYYKAYERGKCSIPQIAYILATARLETKKYHKDMGGMIYFEPVTESGALSYFNKYDPVLADTEAHRQRAKDNGNTQQGDGYKYRGRGYVQVTWKNNYKKIGDKINKDLVGNPDLALDPEVAAFGAVYGMETGLFAGKKLADYIDENSQDYIGARRIINGQDQAQLIAGFADRFKGILEDTKC